MTRIVCTRRLALDPHINGRAASIHTLRAVGLPRHLRGTSPRTLQRIAFRENDSDGCSREERDARFRRDLERELDHMEGSIDDIALDADILEERSELEELEREPRQAVPDSLHRPKTVHYEVTAQYWGPWRWPVWSRWREIWLCRIAMLGFGAACVGEIITHKGIMGQVQLWTGLPHGAVQLLFAGFVLHGLAGALLPNSPTYTDKNLQDVLRRPIDYGGLLAMTRWGFSKKNELLNGRLAMLGFMAALLMEGPSSGLGPLGQLAWWVGRPVGDEVYSTAGLVLAGWAVVATAIAAMEGNLRGAEGDQDVY